MKKIIFITLLMFISAAYPHETNIPLEKEKAAIKKLINMAGTSFNNSEFEKALVYSKEALVRSFKINDDLLIAQSYNSIGVIYDEFSESKRAIEFYKKALVYADNSDNDALKDWINSNLGSAYYFSKIDVNKGIEYYKKSLYYANKINDSTQITYTKLNIASAYFYINDFKSGIVYLDDVRDYISRKGEQEARLSLYSLSGIYSSYHNNPDLAETSFKKAILIAQQNNMPTFLINVYENYAGYLRKYNKVAAAKIYEDKLKKLKDKIYSQQKPNDLKDAAIQIELDEYKSQLEKIEASNEIQQKKIKDSQIISILFGIIMLFLLLLVYILYRNNIFRKKLNAELTIANEELKLAKEKAEENSQLKTQFVSTVSHELRTPLYGVIGITNMILDEHKELVDNEHLNSLKFSARYLLALVNDILQMNKMEDRKIILENSVFSLKEEIGTIKKALLFQADKNGNKLIIDIDSSIPEFLTGDELRLSQILINLISNALKFTKNGEVVVAATLDYMAGEKYFINFKIKDNGIGIAKEDQDKIFDKFVQIERKEEDYQGTGLGLAIVKSLIALFDSEINLESEENTGTVFSFTIGFEKGEDMPQTLVNEKTMEPLDHALNILVVEDNKINQMVTKKIIERNHHHCQMAANGHEAIALVDKEKFDVILMDINMPILSGYETSKRMRAMGITIPIIALTAFDKKEVTEEALVSGINDIIIKPFEPSQLFSMIYKHIANAEKDTE